MITNCVTYFCTARWDSSLKANGYLLEVIFSIRAFQRQVSSCGSLLELLHKRVEFLNPGLPLPPFPVPDPDSVTWESQWGLLSSVLSAPRRPCGGRSPSAAAVEACSTSVTLLKEVAFWKSIFILTVLNICASCQDVTNELLHCLLLVMHCFVRRKSQLQLHDEITLCFVCTLCCIRDSGSKSALEPHTG